MRRLSSYLDTLAGLPGDTPVFVLEGRRPGGTLVVVGGTHGNEVAGYVAATVVVEAVSVEQGRLVVVPFANRSAMAVTDPDRPCPPWLFVHGASGLRRFPCGARRTSREHQGAADPVEIRDRRGGEPHAGEEARNLDRAYPGRADGTLTERVAWAVTELLTREGTDIAIDLHESGPDSRLAWTVVAHPRSVELAAAAIVALDESGLKMKLEVSSETFAGLSHREWGDWTGAHVFLVETPNPGQSSTGDERDVVSDPALPLTVRVGAHLDTISALVDAYNASSSDHRKVHLAGVPGLAAKTRTGFENVLR